MIVTKEDILQMRRTLESDRELCSNSPLAQSYLDGCEEIQNTLAAELVAANPEEVLVMRSGARSQGTSRRPLIPILG